MKNNFYCFIHLPKVAGSTFHTIMYRNFGSHYVKFTHGFFEGFIPSNNIKLMLDSGIGFKAIGGHRVSCDIPINHNKFNTIAIGFIRNPVERFISEYYYIKKQGLNFDLSDSSSLHDFVDQVIKDNNKYTWYINMQYKRMNASLTDIEKLIENKNLYLFPMEEFDKGLLLLNKLFPHDFKDVSYKRINVNKDKPRHIDSGIKDKINTLMSDDIKLYDISKNCLMNNISEAFYKNEIKKSEKHHKIKCKIRSMLIDPVSTFIHKLARGVEYIKLPY